MAEQSLGLWQRAFKKVQFGYIFALCLLALVSLLNHITTRAVHNAQTRTTQLANTLSQQRSTIEQVRQAVALIMRTADLQNNAQSVLATQVQQQLLRLSVQIRENHRILIQLNERQSQQWFIDNDLGPALYGEPYFLDQELLQLEQRLEILKNADLETLNWQLSIWAPLAISLAPKGTLFSGLSYAETHIFQQLASFAEKAERIHYALWAMTLLTLLTELLFIFRPLLRRLRDEHQTVADLNRALHRQVMHDPLTALGNRSKFQQDLQALECSPSALLTCVFLLDLDNFKTINDIYGHSVGDELLQVIAQRLCAFTQAQEYAYRLGGDEFAIVSTRYPDLESALIAGQCLVQQLKQYFEHQALELPVCVSVGIAGPQSLHDMPHPELLTKADIALRRAKRNKPNAIQAFDYIGDVDTQMTKALVPIIAKSLYQREFLPFYQPIVDINNDRICAVEALVRWQAPEHGLLAPKDFMGIIEDLDLINELTLQLLQSIADDARHLRELGIGPIKFSINTPECFLIRQNMLDCVCEILGTQQLDWVQFEILETVLLTRSSERIKENLAQFRRLGGKVALDDFGTGYASLSHLRDFPCDVLKIDQSFVMEMSYALKTRFLTKGIIDMSKGLGIEVVAEGVEEHLQKSLLETWGVRFIQGYYYAKPMPFQQLTQRLRQPVRPPKKVAAHLMQ